MGQRVGRRGDSCAAYSGAGSRKETRGSCGGPVRPRERAARPCSQATGPGPLLASSLWPRGVSLRRWHGTRAQPGSPPCQLRALGRLSPHERTTVTVRGEDPGTRGPGRGRLSPGGPSRQVQCTSRQAIPRPGNLIWSSGPEEKGESGDAGAPVGAAGCPLSNERPLPAPGVSKLHQTTCKQLSWQQAGGQNPEPPVHPWGPISGCASW